MSEEIDVKTTKKAMQFIDTGKWGCFWKDSAGLHLVSGDSEESAIKEAIRLEEKGKLLDSYYHYSDLTIKSEKIMKNIQSQLCLKK